MRQNCLIPVVAFFFSTACLIFVPQVASTSTTNPPTVTPTIGVLSTKTPLHPIAPQRPAATPTATIELTPQWTLSAPSPADRSIYKADLAPEYQSMLATLPYASLYDIEFNIADDLYHITGHETVTYTNAENVELREIKLRLFANILDGKMEVENVTVNNKTVNPIYTLDNSLLTIQLGDALQPQKSVTLAMDFNLTVAQTIGSHYSVQAYNDNVLTLAHAYPMIAVYDDEGWNAEIPAAIGDLTYADMSFYVVTVEAPARVMLAGSGREISREESANHHRVVYAAGPARDFYLAASADYSVVTKDADGVVLRFYVRKAQASGAQYALDVAARAIAVFAQRYAPYPYRELDFVSTPTDAGGVEYPGMIAIARRYINPGDTFLEAIAAHEVGHQWFYNLVGNDQLDEPWLDESLTQFITLQYFTEAYGQTGGDTFRSDLERRWEYVNYDNIPIGLPVREYDKDEYNAIIYGRGALFFEALRNTMGVEAFDAFIQDYTQTYAWDIATTERLKKKAEEHCACDLTPLFQKWIYP
jgi:aminopeptidase N